MPGLITHWKVFRDAAAIVAAGSPPVAGAGEVLYQEPVFTFGNGTAPGRKIDQKTAYYGARHHFSAYSYLGAHAPSYAWLGIVPKLGWDGTVMKLAALHDAARDGPAAEARKDLIELRDRWGLKIAPFAFQLEGTPLFIEGMGPGSFVRPVAQELQHSNKAGTLVLNYLALARTLERAGRRDEAMRLLAYTLGHVAHMAADLVIHPLVSSLAGYFRDPAVDDVIADAPGTHRVANGHRYVEMHQDAYVALVCFGRPITRGDLWRVPLDRLLAEKRLGPLQRLVSTALAATYPGHEAEVSPEVFRKLGTLYSTMLDTYKEPFGIHPGIPLMALVAPKWKGREDGAVQAAVDADHSRRLEIIRAKRAVDALPKRPAAKPGEVRPDDEARLAAVKKVRDLDRAYMDEVLLGEGGPEFLEHVSRATKLAATFMRVALEFFAEGKEQALEVFQDWSLDSGYRIAPQWDPQEAKGSFPRLRLGYYHILADIDQKRRGIDVASAGEAPKEEGKRWRVHLPDYDAAKDPLGDDAFKLSGAGAKPEDQETLVLGAADGEPSPDQKGLSLIFSGVKAGEKYTLEVDQGKDGGKGDRAHGPRGTRYYVFVEKEARADELLED